jgi:hypothetical protein
MPVSKHRKKGLTPRQWRKRRNKRNLQGMLDRKSEMRRATMKMMQQQMLDEAEKKDEDGGENAN